MKDSGYNPHVIHPQETTPTMTPQTPPRFSKTTVGSRESHFDASRIGDFSQLTSSELVDLKLFFEGTQELLCIGNFEGRFLQVNPAWERHLGWTMEELTSTNWVDFVHPDDVEASVNEFNKLLGGAATLGFENRYRCRDGSYRWLSWNAHPNMESRRVMAVVRDVTGNKRERLRANSHHATLSLLASGAALPTVLESIVLGVEQEHPGMICSILLLDRDGKRLKLGASPSLPEPYNLSIDGISIGPNVGSCGTACFYRKRVIVDDIDTDSKWEHCRHLAQSAGLRSCWSEPILSADGQVLGVFGNYRRMVYVPKPEETQTVCEAAKFAALAIERQRSQESMNLARITIDKTTLAVYWIKPDSTVVDVNTTACDVLQYSQSELIGMSVSQFDPNYSLEVWSTHWNELREKKKLTFVSKHRRKDGTEFDVEIRAHHIQFGEEELNFAFVQEITERIQSEMALRKSHKQYQSIVETASEGVWMVDTDGYSTFVNARLSELLGLAPDQILGKPFASFVDKKCQSAVSRVLSMDQDHIERPNDFCFLRSDQSELWAIVSSTPLRNDGQDLSGWLIMVTDITDRKRMEEKLVIAQQRAEDANRIKSEFVANMSHEIRTPMTAILGYADVLADESNRSLTDEQRLQYFNTIKRNGKHLLTIIDDILDIAKIEAGKLAVEKIKTDPVQTLLDVTELMQVKAEAKGLLLETEFQTAMPDYIKSDPVRLRQILMNLVGNAIKFTQSGKITVSGRFVSSKKPEIQFIVTDTGIGMTREAMARLFGSFEQADASTKRRFGGSGLGLRISQSLAAMLGGRISVESRLGEGSTFTLSITTGPLVDCRFRTETDIYELATATTPPMKIIRPTGRPSRASLSGVRILLAEDGLDNQRLVAFHLRKEGAGVWVVENGRNALVAMGIGNSSSKPEKLPFDLIITDMQMPEMDGLELTQHLRSLGYDTPILALTAHAMHSDALKCLAVGCNEHLPKPIDRDRLISSCLKWSNR